MKFCTILHAICALSIAFSGVKHLSQYWQFDFPKKADTSVNTDSIKGFTLQMQVDTRHLNSDTTILAIPGFMAVRLSNQPDSHSGQNYAAFPLSDGTVPVLDGELTLHSPFLKNEGEKLRVGVPLAMLKRPKALHQVVFRFDGVRWSLYVDNQLVDNDFAIGQPAYPGNVTWQTSPEFVKSVAWYPTAVPIRRNEKAKMPASELMYFTPYGHNSWVGDVVSCYYHGRYHLFYLFDRRNHGSKFGRGGHYFEHLSTADFKTWTEHHPALTIDNPFETLGTGTAFVYNDKMYMSYGLHTSRIVPDELTLSPRQWDFYKQHGYTGSFLTDTIKGLYPSGSSFGEWDEDRDAFVKSNIIFHPCENPSIHIDQQGQLTLLANYHAKGTWTSDSIQGGWHCIDENFPPGGDCTFPFRWGNYDYIVGGFHGMWCKKVDEGKDAYRDMSAMGIDFYNGLGVPSMTQLPDGRYLMAGWLGMRRWGGPLMVYEMTQQPDGQLGTRWMQELIPETRKWNDITTEVNTDGTYNTETTSFMLTFDIQPTTGKDGRMTVQFLSDTDPKVSRQWQLSLNELRAQYGPAANGQFGTPERTIHEGGNPNDAGNYAISHLTGVDKPFTVRIVVKYTDKLAGSIIDTEIARQRTMLDYQERLKVNNVKFLTDGVKVTNIKIAPLKH